VNYFGHQRFGHEVGVATCADAVGLAMLQGDMVKAVELLLMPDLNKNDEAKAAKRYNNNCLVICFSLLFVHYLI